MKRRSFIAASFLAGASQGCWLSSPRPQRPEAERLARSLAGGKGKQYLELRLYKMKDKAKAEVMTRFLADAAIPAWNRIGIKPVGVFQMSKGGSPDIYVLLPHMSLETLVNARRQVMADAKFRKAGASFLNAPGNDPAYQRIVSSLMISFDGVPKVQTPTKKASRIFQLRTYESHNNERALKKIEMFNTGGELNIFNDSGMPPVFFGETLIGSKVPNLTYMLAFDDDAARKKAWDKFISSPAWKKLSKDKAYKGTVSNITNIMLRPADCSQI